MTRINGKESGLKSYSRLNRRNIITLAVLTLVCVLSCVGDILTGAAKLPGTVEKLPFHHAGTVREKLTC